ncbi:MAG: BMP family ABC transporter substrate-binding protein [Anaerolineae bacterium]
MARDACGSGSNPTLFIGVDQFVADGPTNYVGIQFREDQAGFLVGAMAALMTQSGTIAGVYGIDIPPVIKFRNGYEQGARYINPEINVLGVYIDSFTAPDRGAAAAEQFIGDGADVVFGAGGPTGSGAITFASTQENVWVIGVDQDEYNTTFGGGETPGADRLITSALKRVDNGVYQLLQIAAGTDESAWPGGSIYVLEVANDGISFAEAHDAAVPQEVTDQVTVILEGIRDGSISTGVDPVTGELLEPVAPAMEATEMATEEATEMATEEATMEATEAAMEATEEATEVAMEATPTPTEEATETAAAGFGGIQSVCLVTDVGRINDGTFNQFAYEGMLRAAEDLGLENTFIETQAQTDYATNISTCLDEGYDAIVTVGFLIADATRAAAEANPGTLFIGVDQFVADGPTNYVGIQFREDQAGFLVGAMAALMTQSGTIAGVYGIDIPPVIKFRNGYEQGARYINPEINVLGVYIDSFTAPDRSAAAAEQFIGDGADVVPGAGGPDRPWRDHLCLDKTGDWCRSGRIQHDLGGGETPADRLITSALKRCGQRCLPTRCKSRRGRMKARGRVAASAVLEVANDGISFAEAHDAAVPQEVTDQVTVILKASATVPSALVWIRSPEPRTCCSG